MWILVEVGEPHDVGKDELQRILIYDITIDVAPLVSDLYVVAEGHAVHPATPSDTREHIDAEKLPRPANHWTDAAMRARIESKRKSDTEIITEKASGRGAPGPEPPIPRGMPTKR